MKYCTNYTKLAFNPGHKCEAQMAYEVHAKRKPWLKKHSCCKSQVVFFFVQSRYKGFIFRPRPHNAAEIWKRNVKILRLGLATDGVFSNTFFKPEEFENACFSVWCFDKGGFRKRWRYDDDGISVTEFSSNTRIQNDRRLLSFRFLQRSVDGCLDLLQCK